MIALTLENSNKYEEFYKQINIQETSKNIAYNKYVELYKKILNYE